MANAFDQNALPISVPTPAKMPPFDPAQSQVRAIGFWSPGARFLLSSTFFYNPAGREAYKRLDRAMPSSSLTSRWQEGLLRCITALEPRELALHDAYSTAALSLRPATTSAKRARRRSFLWIQAPRTRMTRSAWASPQ